MHKTHATVYKAKIQQEANDGKEETNEKLHLL